MLKDVYCATFFGHPHLVAVAEVAVVVGLLSLVLVFDSIRILVACGGTVLCMGGPESGICTPYTCLCVIYLISRSMNTMQNLL